MPREIITRRNLPHWYMPTAVHSVTYRLVGTIPMEVLQAFRTERDRLRNETPSAAHPEVQREDIHNHFFAGYDEYLDSHRQVAWLAEPVVAALVRENLYHHDGSLYHLIAYCIMPNHVHVLIQPTADLAPSEATIEPIVATTRPSRNRADCGYDADSRYEDDERPDRLGPLGSILRSIKSYTAHEANKLLRRSGQFWQHESYDHWVRDGKELMRIVHYMAWNPVKAGLAGAPAAWFWGSAHDRYLSDGTEEGLLRYPAPP